MRRQVVLWVPQPRSGIRHERGRSDPDADEDQQCERAEPGTGKHHPADFAKGCVPTLRPATFASHFERESGQDEQQKGEERRRSLRDHFSLWLL
jgi:hypothetical protein